jgi:hypothetical protein
MFCLGNMCTLTDLKMWTRAAGRGGGRGTVPAEIDFGGGESKLRNEVFQKLKVFTNLMSLA